jgi:hypothetical protein
MRWLLKSSFDQIHYLINYIPSSDFKNHIIIWWTPIWHVELLILDIYIRNIYEYKYYK